MLKTKIWLEPRQETLKVLPDYPGEPEMTEFDSGFLCGLLREYRPKKMLEVGIAGGGNYGNYFGVPVIIESAM